MIRGDLENRNDIERHIPGLLNPASENPEEHQKLGFRVREMYSTRPTSSTNSDSYCLAWNEVRFVFVEMVRGNMS